VTRTAKRRPAEDGTALAESAGRAEHHGRRRVVAAVPHLLATSPRVLAIASMGDERSVNEVTGWLIRAASQGCLHERRPAVDLPTLELLGGPRTVVLLRLAVKAGLLAPTKADDGRTLYQVHPGIARPVRGRGEG